MNIFQEYSSHLAQFTVERQEADLFKILKESEAAAVDLNINQMLSGIDSNGEFITPEYTERTVEIKKAKGQPYDRVTLRDEGDFHRSMFMEGSSFPATFNSTDYKTPFLEDKYGEFFGLTKESKSDLREGYTNAEVKRYYREQVLRLR